MYWRLDFIDNDFILIDSQDIPLKNHRQIRNYHVELIKALNGLNVWPVETDSVLYPKHKKFYEKIIQKIGISFNCDRLEPSSRHCFFVCTEPVEDPKTKQKRLGASGLEQIMGYQYAEAEEETESKIKPVTSGDALLDIEVDIFLIFKEQAPWLIENHSLSELGKMAIQANNRLKQAEDAISQDKEKEGITEDKPDSETFLKYKDRILLTLQSLKVPIPEGF